MPSQMALIDAFEETKCHNGPPKDQRTEGEEKVLMHQPQQRSR